jgi:hypothetical protein
VSPQNPSDHETGEPVVPVQPAQLGIADSTCPVTPQASPPSPAVPPKIAERKSKCAVCKEWIKAGAEMRGTGNGNGKGYLWAHRWCAPTLDDLRWTVREAVGMSEKAGGKKVVVKSQGPLWENPEAAAALFKEAPPVFVFDRAWEPRLGEGYEYDDPEPGGELKFQDEEDFGDVAP